jgi:hypothetical protein
MYDTTNKIKPSLESPYHRLCWALRWHVVKDKDPSTCFVDVTSGPLAKLKFASIA